MGHSNIYKHVGNNLATRRNELNLTQSKVAIAAEISRPSLANIEKGNQTITLHQLYKLANALELDDARKLLPAATSTMKLNPTPTTIKIKTTSKNLNDGHRTEVQKVLSMLGKR